MAYRIGPAPRNAASCRRSGPKKRRPVETGNVIEPLDNLGSVPFSGATTVDNGQTVDLAQAGTQLITMLNSGNQLLAMPSAIGSDGSSFMVTRTAAQATTSAIGRGGRRGGTPPAGGR